MKLKLFSSVIAMLATVSTMGTAAVFGYGSVESHAIGAHCAVSYSDYTKQTRGRTQTLNTYVVGTNTKTDYYVTGQIGADTSYTTLTNTTTVTKGDTWNITLSNSVDSGKRIRLYYKNYFDVNNTDYISYRYLHE